MSKSKAMHIQIAFANIETLKKQSEKCFMPPHEWVKVKWMMIKKSMLCGLKEGAKPSLFFSPTVYKCVKHVSNSYCSSQETRKHKRELSPIIIFYFPLCSYRIFVLFWIIIAIPRQDPNNSHAVNY